MSRFSETLLVRIAFFAVSLSAILMAARAIGAISFFEPLQAATRGCEYESSFVFWKYLNGEPVFVDQTRIPFAGTYYNWLYYWSYGGLIGGVLKLFSLSEAWLPTISKLITMGGAIFGFFVCRWSFLRLTCQHDSSLRPWANLLAALLFCGPLMGFWAISNAPDVWGWAFDVASVGMFLFLYGRKPVMAVLSFCLFAYLAWSMKQIFVYGPAVAGTFLLLRRDWRHLALLTAVMLLAWGATLALGGPVYLKSMLAFGGTKVKLEWEYFFNNLSNFGAKHIPLIAALLLLPALWRDVRRLPTEAPVMFFAAIGVVVSFTLSLPASAKQGAAENYYFIPSFYLALFLLSGLAWLKQEKRAVPNYFFLAQGVGWVVVAAGVMAVLGGFAGVVSARKYHDGLLQMNREIGPLPEPSYLANPYLELPWIRSKTPNFVLHCSYFWDRVANVPMERNGVGGLIAEGYFASLVLPGIMESYDGGRLDKYQPLPEPKGGFTIYLRKEP
jgi:hypothetical protein